MQKKSKEKLFRNHWENGNTQHYFANCTISRHQLMIGFAFRQPKRRNKANKNLQRSLLILVHEWQNQEFRSIFFTTIDAKKKTQTTSFIILSTHSLFVFWRKKKHFKIKEVSNMCVYWLFDNYFGIFSRSMIHVFGIFFFLYWINLIIDFNSQSGPFFKSIIYVLSVYLKKMFWI